VSAPTEFLRVRAAAFASAWLLSGCAGVDDTATNPPVATPQPAAQYLNVAFTEHPRRLRLDLYTPAGTAPFPVLVWIHGGGWSSGDENLFFGHPLLRQWSRGYAVAAVEYRLSGEAVYPAQIHDSKAAVRWLRGNAVRYGLDATRIAVWGASAGGHLAALLGTSGGVAALEDPAQGHADQSSRVAAVVDWFGPADLTLVPPGRGRDAPEAQLLGCAPEDCPERARLASPLTFVDGTEPPFLIQHGTADRTVDFRHSERLHAALLAAGVRSSLTLLPGADHIDIAFLTAENQARIDTFLDGLLTPGR
jgi:acetyl esterase/lipase